MKIQKIFIYEFGGLKDLLIMPEDGITLVRGGNESGKSTVMSFISFIFYGLPAKKGEGITERSRALSWTGGRASGIMEIESTPPRSLRSTPAADSRTRSTGTTSPSATICSRPAKPTDSAFYSRTVPASTTGYSGTTGSAGTP